MNMKKLLLSVIVCFLSVITFAQEEQQTKEVMSKKDSVLFDYLEIYSSQLREPCYALFPTDNMWTFLKLETPTGKIWRVQFSIKGNSYRFQTPVSTLDRVYDGEYICGRFTLYKTQNMYNFILLDRIDGRCWQVQWSQDDANGVWTIYHK